MTKFLEITAAVEEQDLYLVQISKIQMLNAFPGFLEISRHARQISITDFAILYYDLYSFHEKELKRDGRYHIKQVRRFAARFEEMYNLLHKFSEEKELYVVSVFENLRDNFKTWFEMITKPIEYDGE